MYVCATCHAKFQTRQQLEQHFFLIHIRPPHPDIDIFNPHQLGQKFDLRKKKSSDHQSSEQSARPMSTSSEGNSTSVSMSSEQNTETGGRGSAKKRGGGSAKKSGGGYFKKNGGGSNKTKVAPNTVPRTNTKNKKKATQNKETQGEQWDWLDLGDDWQKPKSTQQHASSTRAQQVADVLPPPPKYPGEGPVVSTTTKTVYTVKKSHQPKICTICGTLYPRTSITRHFKKKHGEMKPKLYTIFSDEFQGEMVKCGICKAFVKKEDNILQHYIDKHYKPIGDRNGKVCRICNTFFVGTFKKHMESRHRRMQPQGWWFPITKQRQYVNCGICKSLVKTQEIEKHYEDENSTRNPPHSYGFQDRDSRPGTQEFGNPMAFMGGEYRVGSQPIPWAPQGGV